MVTELVFATNNKHKLGEVRQIISDRVRLLSLADIACYDDIAETADTLEGNALLKARYIRQGYGYDCFADDTGLEVEALNNAPGVYSARYAGEGNDASANMDKLLCQMQGLENRKARFRTVIALIVQDKEYLFEGIIKGAILTERRGEAGFGYDPLFVPEGYVQTFAQMGHELKNLISHRALAVKELATFLSTYS
ncbi:MAG: non-canonical purine NTP diphosphatase [Tannerellaceae bacterium]|jgi:XTP/dITP diphosphohydrolase|nr:non-canonical purine NTP diphosphatase [Tannerellaceae bacterium]